MHGCYNVMAVMVMSKRRWESDALCLFVFTVGLFGTCAVYDTFLGAEPRGDGNVCLACLEVVCFWYLGNYNYSLIRQSCLF